jgi:hypothetical protein
MKQKRKFSRREEVGCKDFHRTADVRGEGLQALHADKNLVPVKV